MGVSLVKGQKISLAKSGSGLSRIFMGLGWDAARSGFLGGLLGGGGAIDLDASCLVFDAAGALVEEIWFRRLKGVNGAIRHSGDNRTGDGDGDDEVIHVDLAALPETVRTLVFTVNSFTGQTFERVANASCRVVDSTTNQELAIFRLSESGPHTGLIIARIYRLNGEWKLHAIGEKTTGRTFHDMMPAIRAVL